MWGIAVEVGCGGTSKFLIAINVHLPFPIHCLSSLLPFLLSLSLSLLAAQSSPSFATSQQRATQVHESTKKSHSQSLANFVATIHSHLPCHWQNHSLSQANQFAALVSQPFLFEIGCLKLLAHFRGRIRIPIRKPPTILATLEGYHRDQAGVPIPCLKSSQRLARHTPMLKYLALNMIWTSHMVL